MAHLPPLKELTVGNDQPTSSRSPSDSDPGGENSAGMKNRITTWIVKCLLVIGTLMVCLAILEIGLRVTGRHRSDGLVGFHAPRGVSY